MVFRAKRTEETWEFEGLRAWSFQFEYTIGYTLSEFESNTTVERLI